MTTKQELFRAIRKRSLNLAHFQGCHPTVQFRRVGKDLVQFRVRSGDPWMNLSDFTSLFVSQSCKELNDHLAIMRECGISAHEIFISLDPSVKNYLLDGLTPDDVTSGNSLAAVLDLKSRLRESEDKRKALESSLSECNLN